MIALLKELPRKICSELKGASYYAIRDSTFVDGLKIGTNKMIQKFVFRPSTLKADSLDREALYLMEKDYIQLNTARLIIH